LIAPERSPAHEALLRWQHPERGLVACRGVHPARGGDRSHPRIGEWALREACRWATFIGVERNLPVAVNLSRGSSTIRGWRGGAAALRDTGLPPRLLELEITESTAMQHTDVTLGTLATEGAGRVDRHR
jgi:EAL domain-containing protein (putative c-di-GMP-specific phosphodiesterase class I)